ncbi:LacI family DNA-binding transcriptional regulator [Brevibacterium pigmentatum]|uniref:LacI family DNA-binding transcriptional regulator n=1 Tax=Brevibacterium pigmentatum TaxID=1496080 RepID=UPI002B1BD0B8|nr:LacI family DNA-binding transcriptional regulator [Brevibacterium pigmentatum]
MQRWKQEECEVDDYDPNYGGSCNAGWRPNVEVHEGTLPRNMELPTLINSDGTFRHGSNVTYITPKVKVASESRCKLITWTTPQRVLMLTTRDNDDISMPRGDRTGPPRPTLVGLATHLGLSKTTVSDALAGRGRMSAATRDRVQQAAKELGYRGNRIARGLRSGRSNAIGLYIPLQVRSFGYFMEFAHGATAAAAQIDCDLLLIARDPSTTAGALPQVDAVIVVDPIGDDPALAAFIDSDLPVVTAGRVLGPKQSQVDATVQADHRGTAAKVAGLLHQRGHGRIALVCSDAKFQSSATKDMCDGYRDYCHEFDVGPSEHPLPITASDHEIHSVVRRIVTDPQIGGIVFGPQGFAQRALVEITKSGRNPNTDIAIGSLVSSAYAADANESVVAVNLRAADFGARAVEIVAQVLNGVRFLPSEVVTHSVEITSR